MSVLSNPYDAIHRALKVKERIQVYCFQNRDELLLDELTRDDWDHLQAIHDGLEPFWEATEVVQSNDASVWQVLPIIEALLSAMEAAYGNRVRP